MKNRCLIDSHVHYDHPLFQGDGPAIIKNLFESSVISACVNIPITYESNFIDRSLYPENVYFAVGLHPKAAINEPWWNKEKRVQFEALLKDKRTVAIKTGLEYRSKLTDAQKDHEKNFLRYLISLGNEYDLPLVLHIRDVSLQAPKHIVEVLQECSLRVETVVHCFTYDYDIAKMMLDSGTVTRLGIGAMIDRDEMDGLREAVKRIPIESILIETDAPFVKPMGYTETVNTSVTLFHTASKIAELRNMTVYELIPILNQNVKDFYKLH